jgi:hypothetical protein
MVSHGPKQETWKEGRVGLVMERSGKQPDKKSIRKFMQFQFGRRALQEGT